MKDADFLRKVSHLPIVRGTLRAYELSKQHSRVVKVSARLSRPTPPRGTALMLRRTAQYGSDLVESGVKAISRPVVSRVSARLGEKGVEQLDAFAARQLERVSDRDASRGPHCSTVAQTCTVSHSFTLRQKARSRARSAKRCWMSSTSARGQSGRT